MNNRLTCLQCNGRMPVLPVAVDPDGNFCTLRCAARFGVGAVALVEALRDAAASGPGVGRLPLRDERDVLSFSCGYTSRNSPVISQALDDVLKRFVK